VAQTPATWLAEAVRSRQAFALWREPGQEAVRGLATDTVNAVGPNAALPIDQRGFCLHPFSPSDSLPALHLAADNGIINLSADSPSTGQEPVTLAALSAFAAGPAPEALDSPAYRRLVAAGVTAIRAGELDKMVASRAEPRALDRDFDIAGYFGRLCTAYSQAMVALVGVRDRGLWIVATPETLLRVEEGAIRTMALAGTQPLAPEDDPADALWSAKFIEEQALVSRYIRDAFADAGITTFDERGPVTVRAANLAHLCSYFEAPLQGGNPNLVGELLARLHPTSAVSGMPREAALSFLAREEGYDRSYYTGFLGPCTDDGRSAFYVNLRSARFIGSSIIFYVGAGVTGDSDPAAEWEETVQKTKTLGNLL